MPPCPSLMDSDAANRRRWRSFRVEKVQRIASSTGRGYLVIITASCQKLKNPFPDRPDYQPNRAPKRPNATVNKFCILTAMPALFRLSTPPLRESVPGESRCLDARHGSRVRYDGWKY